MTDDIPEAQEREVRFLGSAAIDGTPIAYIIVLAAVVTALSFIPISITLGTSASAIPLSGGILPLLGWLLGPVAGAVACGIGTFIGAFLAPYTAGILPLTVGGAALASLIAGLMGNQHQTRQRGWSRGLIGLAILAYVFLAARAIVQNGVDPKVFIAGTFIDWSALILFALPVSRWIAGWLQSDDLKQLAGGLFLGTWIAGGVSHLFQMSIAYAVFNWPQEIWVTLIPMIPFEQVVRGLVGMVIGARVISGLRSLYIIKPPTALY